MKTAVEWLMDEYEHSGHLTRKTFKNALEMEKQQIINSFYQGQKKDISLKVFAFGENYYNETFNNK